MITGSSNLWDVLQCMGLIWVAREKLNQYISNIIIEMQMGKICKKKCLTLQQ